MKDLREDTKCSMSMPAQLEEDWTIVFVWKAWQEKASSVSKETGVVSPYCPVTALAKEKKK